MTLIAPGPGAEPVGGLLIGHDHAELSAPPGLPPADSDIRHAPALLSDSACSFF